MNWVKVFVLINIACITSVIVLIEGFSRLPAGKTMSIVASSPVPDTRCIIQIDGISYTITEFRKIHSGGDIFTCGSDMSQIFHNQHPQSFLNSLEQYRI